jgi:hypothetical protein
MVMSDLVRMAAVNDSGYSSQPTARDSQCDNMKLQSLSFSNKQFIDPNEFNREYTVGMVTADIDRHRHSQQSFVDSSKVGNITLYPTPDGYVLGPHAVNVTRDVSPGRRDTSLSRSIAHTDSQFFASVTIPPDGLSSNRPAHLSHNNTNDICLQGPVILRQNTILPSEHVSPISVKLRSLKFPQVEHRMTTDVDSLRDEIVKTNDEIEYLRIQLQEQEQNHDDHAQYQLLKDTLEQQMQGLIDRFLM